MTALRYRLQIPHNLWARAWAEMSLGRRTLAWGRMHRSLHGRCCDLLVHSMKYVTEPPLAQEYSLQHDFFVLDAPGQRTEDGIRDLLDSMRLRPGQLLTYVQPDLQGEAGSWIGAVYDGRQLQPLHSLHLIGSGMLRLTRGTAAEAPSGPQWSRLAGALGEAVFQRFRNREILLVGAGRLGSLMASTLVRMGLRRLTVVDPDVLEPHNRDATVGNTARDCGQPKVTALLRHLHRVRASALLRGFNLPVQDPRLLDAFRRCAAVFVCVDNDDARLYVSQAASQLLKVVLDCGTLVRRAAEPVAAAAAVSAGSAAGLSELLSDVRLILPGSCLACVGGLRPTAEAIVAAGLSPQAFQGLLEPAGVQSPASATRSAAGAGSGGVQHASAAELRGVAASAETAPAWTRAGRIGSLPSLNHLAVGTALQIWQDLLSERLSGSWWQRLHWAPGQGLRTEAGPLAGRTDCPVCGARGR